jgi:hypothetical protein
MSNIYYEELYFEDGNENSGEDGPAKSQVQWKMFAIVYAHLKYGKDLPDWWGVRGPDHTIPNFQNIVDGATVGEIKLKLKTPVPWTSLPCALTDPNPDHLGHDTCSEEGFSDFIDKAPPDFKKELEKYGSGEYAKDAQGDAKTKQLAKGLGKDAGKKMGQAVKDFGMSGKDTSGDKKPSKSSKPSKLPGDTEKMAQKIRDYLEKTTGSGDLHAPSVKKPSKKGVSKTGPKGGKKSSTASKKVHDKLGWKGKQFNRSIKNFQKALERVGTLSKSKSKTARQLRKLGFTDKHQKAAVKHGDWTRSPVRPGSTLFDNLNKLGRMRGRRPIRKHSRMYRNESVDTIKEIIREEITEAMSSTERMRRYNKKHPEKVSKHLKDTTSDRVERNRAHREATQKHGESYMKDKDVHHPDGVTGGKTMVVGQDHGRDKKPNKKKTNETNKNNSNLLSNDKLINLIKHLLKNIFGGDNEDN